MIDYAIAVDRVLPGAKWLRANDYATLVATWQDAQPVPEESVLVTAYAEWEADQLRAGAVTQVQEGADAQLLAVSGFARWTEQQFLDWIESNISDAQIDTVTNLAQARVIMKKQTIAFTVLMRLVVGLRNKVAPHLQDNG